MITQWLFTMLIRHVANQREPDKVIGGAEFPYLRRWYVTPWRAWHEGRFGWFWKLMPNIYLHQFLRSDDDRALHDHPWFNASWILKGSYHEETILYGGRKHRVLRKAGGIKFRTPWAAHRVELLPQKQRIACECMANPVCSACKGKGYTFFTSSLPGEQCWTLFITGPVLREWGFHCPDKGWVHWKKFTDEAGTSIGAGCE